MKIGIMSDSLRLPLFESLEKSRELGADGVQMYAVRGEMAPENLNDRKVAELNRVLQENGLEVSALCGDMGGGFTDPGTNPEKILRSKRIIDLALALNTNIVTTHIGVVPEDMDSDTYKILQEACNELAEYAGARHAFFAIETGPEPAERLKTFLDSLDHKGVAVNLDPANLVMVCGDDPVKAVELLSPYVVHTHAKDGIRYRAIDSEAFYTGKIDIDGCFEEVPLGKGSVNFPTYLAALKAAGYDSYLTIEREVGEDPAKDISEAVRFLRSLI